MSEFHTLPQIAGHLRQKLEEKECVLLFAHNGTGKTRLSMAFKELGKQDAARDTLYFNAFTEDLFSWDNNIEDDTGYKLQLNTQSEFFTGLEELEMDTRIRHFLNRYADFNFRIDTGEWVVRFFPKVSSEDSSENVDDIKISRGEENLFIWCFFLAIVQLVIDTEIEAYNWVKYIYIDDPISSLDENNVIAVGYDLVQLLKKKDQQHFLKTVISTHHTLFFNMLCHELKNKKQYFLREDKDTGHYSLADTSDTPSFYHVAMLAELQKVADSDEIYTYHFNILRSILEKTAIFHGYTKFSDCIGKDKDKDDGLYARIINIMSHGKYSLYEPQEMLPDNKKHFKKILNSFLQDYNFNIDPPKETTQEEATL